jgi:hypothetical protein
LPQALDALDERLDGPQGQDEEADVKQHPLTTSFVYPDIRSRAMVDDTVILQ